MRRAIAAGDGDIVVQNPGARHNLGVAVLESAGGRRFRIAEYAGFAPALVLFGVFFLVPLGLIVCYSFWQTVDYNVVHEWTVDNYRYFFSVPTYIKTVWATLWVSFLATAITILDWVISVLSIIVFGAVTYASGKLGDEPVRSQGHVHRVSSHSGWSG